MRGTTSTGACVSGSGCARTPASRRSLRPLAVFAVAGATAMALNLHWIVPAGLSLAGGGATVKYNQTAAEAASHSYAPYSHSYAGVALRTHDGHIFSGRYAENAAFNPSLPPLQSALIMLRMAGFAPENIQAVALVESQHGQISHRSATQALLSAYGIDQIQYQVI